MTKKVGIWIRVSTEDQAQGESPRHHEERARHYAKAKDWEIVEVYRLEGVSGKHVKEHPETNRMIQDLKSGKISGLIFSKLARLARHTRQLLDFAELFQQYKADLVSLQESIDTSSPAGRLFYTLIAAMAQWEREEIADRVRASVPIRANLGKPLGGAAPYGYNWIEHELVLKEDEAAIRKLMFELFAEHKRKKTVANILNEAGHRTRKGAKFSDTTITRLLEDPIAKGLRRANYTQSTGEGKQWELKPKEEWVFTPAPRIVSDELWETCNAILEEQQKKNKRQSKRTRHLFSGVVKCHCDQKMYVPSNMDKYVCVKCRNNIGTKDLEEIFHSQLRSFLVSDKLVEEHLGKYQKAIGDKETLMNKLTSDSKNLHKRMEKLIDLYQADEMPKGGFKSHYEPLFEQHEQIQNRIPEIQGEIDFMKSQLLSSDQIISDASNLYRGWSNLNTSEKRSVIENITKSIIIGEKDEITIKLIQITPKQPSSELTANGQRNDTGSYLQQA